MILSPETAEAIRQHALREYPKESCGLVVAGAYQPCFNYADDPLTQAVISRQDYVRAGDALEAIVHSHPNGPIWPSAADMRSQIATAVPWIIVGTDGERCAKFTMWGDSLPIQQLIGRSFMHGVSDCFSLVRDAFRLGKDALAAEGMEWPFEAMPFPDVPRDDDWWGAGQDLYRDALGPRGFREINISEVRPGDGFLCKIRSDKLNHAGLYVGNNLILHHLPFKLSRREPFGLWGRAADMWVRYEGPGS